MVKLLSIQLEEKCKNCPRTYGASGFDCEHCKNKFEKEYTCEKCNGVYEFLKYCGAYVCNSCGNHKDLARCHCGWSESGNNGYTELLEMGEQIEPDY